MAFTTVATCNLNQWALDFTGNKERIIASILEAKSRGARLRVGPELEVTGYGCEDHFLEQDTFLHTWQCVTSILESGCTDGILCDIGLPVMHHGVRYNARLYALNGDVLLIRPKMVLADDGNYREPRWFTAWNPARGLEDFALPDSLRRLVGHDTVPIGFAFVATPTGSVGAEMCEELWVPQSPHIKLALNGVEVITNGSGSHHQLRKLHRRIHLMAGATEKCGSVYVYANQQGCDGGRLYYDGSSCIISNGDMLVQASQFAVVDVEVVVATVDLEDVRAYRGGLAARSVQAASEELLPRVKTSFSLCHDPASGPCPAVAQPVAPRFHSPNEEIGLGPACWLWDYLRRSGASGFFLPLSGGADSASVAGIVAIMCARVVDACRAGDQGVIRDARRVAGEAEDGDYVPTDPRELADRLLCTAYLGSQHSSTSTRDRAAALAKDVGCYHLNVGIDGMVSAVVSAVGAALGRAPRFVADGGAMGEDVALQNVQARLRMVTAYMLAQLLPWARGRRGWLLVLGSANVDEALRGYLTKYDCSSADINPIGGVSKVDLRRFLHWAAEKYPLPTLSAVAGARPTAELRPLADGAGAAEASQDDEEEMGLTYEELSWFGRLRKLHHCGPVSMFSKLCMHWSARRPAEVAEKVKHFFRFYAMNRHKLTTLTPAYHAENYGPDDNRYDLRQFLYNTQWRQQFCTIDGMAAQMEQRRRRRNKSA